jgi:hypothetical protein
MSKQLWGNSTWYIFHTLAEKLKPDCESEIQTILYHFKQVSFNLPCQDCAKHATDMMHNAKLDKVKTRDDLKQFFLEFHNVVNKKLNKPIFSRDECDKLYAKANTVNVVNHFIAVMKSNQIATERTMMHTVTRHLCVDSIAKYMREHGYKYNL